MGASEIRLYRANEKPYGAFSNVFRRPVFFEDTIFPTSEHAYQAGKARKPEVRAWLLAAPSPALVAMAAHGLYTWDIVPDWRSEEHTSELQSLMRISYAVFCLKKKTQNEKIRLQSSIL